jgi:hypothetical protein
MHAEWLGFVFFVQFEVRYPMRNSASSQQPFPLPYPFYLSFESEHTEERFDMPLNLESNKVDGSKYVWTIYISREHCHFVKTGAQITFKAHQGLIMNEWGFHVLTEKDIKGSNMSDLWYSAKLNWEDMVTRGTRLQVERVEENIFHKLIIVLFCHSLHICRCRMGNYIADLLIKHICIFPGRCTCIHT